MKRLIHLLVVLLFSTAAAAQAAPGYLHANGTEIVDGSGKPVLLRGMGLGGWMLQEGYMLQVPNLGQQHVIRAHIAELAGRQATDAFYRSWLDHFVTRADVEAMGRWGFNSIRLPMHYALFLDPDSLPGATRWREDGFRRVDALLDWAAANRIYVILDLHAAPGGQGTDLAISDRDPAKPSLWESADNQQRTVELWRRLAQRYANNPWVGGYDILNEPNWDFEGPGGGHGCEDRHNRPIAELYKRITAAIRSVDRNHMIIIEGNCWGNNYAGITPDWDSNLVLSFHKYWDNADEASLAKALALRDQLHVPIWMGESGENSNAWFAKAIRLVESHGIGWSWWPLKKMGFNNPLEIVPNPGWAKLVAYWNGKGRQPTRAEAQAAIARLAGHDIAFANNLKHRDVIDALFRQPHDPTTVPFRPDRLARQPLRIAAVDYDLGPPGVAYAGRVDSDRHVATGVSEQWNEGRTYRNDGVDIARTPAGEPFVTAFEVGEWLQYTVDAPRPQTRTIVLSARATQPAAFEISNGSARRVLTLRPGQDWQRIDGGEIAFARGTNPLRVKVTAGTIQLEWLELR